MKKILLLMLSTFLLTGCQDAVEKDVKGERAPIIHEEEKTLATNDSRFIDVYNKLLDYTYNKNNLQGYKDFTAIEMLDAVIADLKESNLTPIKGTDEYIRSFTLKKEVILNLIRTVFGPDADFDGNDLVGTGLATGLNPEGSGSGMSIDSFDNATQSFNVSFGGIGGPGFPEPDIEKRKIVSATLKGDIITVIEKAIYLETDSTPDMTTIYIYNNPQKEKLLFSDTYDYEKAEKTIIKVDDYKDDTYTIVTKFKKADNDNYYFLSNSIE